MVCFSRAEAPVRAAMPEPLIGESITDIDRSEAGELEIDFTTSAWRTTTPGLNLWSSSIEVEWGATKHLGLALDFSGATGVGQNSAAVPFDLGLRLGAAWALIHDFERDIHLQLEASARVLKEETENSLELGESSRRGAVDLRGGARRGLWTLRGALGIGLGGSGPRAVSLRGSVAIFHELKPWTRIGFAGLEVEADGGRTDPVVLAPTVVFGWSRLRLGSALVGNVTGAGLSLGVMLRVIYEPG